MLNNDAVTFDYIIIIPGRTFSSQTVLSLIQTTNYLKDIGASFFISIKYNSIVSVVRNFLIAEELFDGYQDYIQTPKNILPFGGKSKAKKIIMIDSDISWTLQDFKLLIENDNDITVGPYRFISNATSVGLSYESFLKVEDLLNYQNPFEIKASGLGFASVKFEVFEKIQYPWFSTIDGNSPEEVVGEDVFFCKKVGNEGFKIICDPRIKIGHTKEITLFI